MKTALTISLLAVLLAQSVTGQQDGERYRGAATLVPTGIWMAAARGDLPAVKKALAEGQQISQQDPIRGYTPLHAALSTFGEDIIQPLVELGADVNAADADGFTPLALAVRAHNPKLVKYLIKAGAQIPREGFTTNSAFALALRWGDLEILKLFVDAGVSPNSTITVSGDGIPALSYAAYAGTADAVEYLHRAGADLETQFGEGQITALFYAAATKRVSTVGRLLKLGADPLKISQKGNSIAVLAAVNDNERAFELLIDAKSPLKGRVDEALSMVWRWGNDRINKKLEAQGHPVIKTDPVLDLAEAALAADLPKAQMLYAKFFGNYEFGRSLLSSAASGGNIEILRLVTADSDPSGFIGYTDSNQRTLTHHAALTGKDAMLAWLIERKPNLGLRDRYGQTPLMCAVREGHLSAVDKLLAAGSPLATVDVDGRSALDLASQLGHDAIVARLKVAMPEQHPQPAEPVQEPKPAAPQAAQNLPAITVAILPTSLVDESWYPTTLALKDLESLVQAQMQTLPGVECVERAELDRIQEELTRQSAGGLSQSQGLAIGTLTSAELLVTSTLRSDRGLGRHLVLRVVDAKHGDVLATRTLHLKQTVAHWLKLTPEVTATILDATVSALHEARTTHHQWQEKKVITLAPLFIGNRTPRLNRLAKQAASLLDQVHHEAKNHTDALRVLRFSGADDATDEAELAISGLTEKDDKAWTKVADHYLWGWCEETGPDSTPFLKMPVKVSLQLVDSSGKLTPFVWDTTVESMQQEMAVKAQEILELVKRSPRGAGGADLGPKIALDLADHAFDLAKATGRTSTRSQQTLINRSLEAARFFDPTNGKIAALWLMERWEGELAKENGVIWNLLACHNDWAEHLERFDTSGLKSVPFSLSYLSFETAPSGYNSLEADWYTSAWYGVCSRVFRALQVVNFIPDGTPPTVRREWRQKVAKDIKLGLLQIHSKHHRYSYQNPIDNLLRPSEPGDWAKVLLEEWRGKVLPEANLLPDMIRRREEYRIAYDDLKAEGAEPFSEIPPGFFQHRRIEFQEPENTWRPAEKTIFSAPKPTSPRLLAEATAAEMPDFWYRATPSVSLSMTSMAAMAFHSVLDSPTDQTRDLYFWQPDTKHYIPVLGFPFVHLPDWLLPAPGKLWVGGYNFGLGYIDLKEKRYRPLPDQDGFPFEHVSSAALLGTDLCVGGGGKRVASGVAMHSAGAGWKLLDGPWNHESMGLIDVGRLIASPSSLYVFYNWRRHMQDRSQTRLVVLDRSTQKWSSQTSRIPSPDKHNSGASSDADGLWMLMTHDVAYIPSDTLTPASLIALPPDVKHNRPGTLIHDGDWLWIGTNQSDQLEPPVGSQYWSATCRVILIHKPSRRYAGCYELGLGDLMYSGILLTPDFLMITRSQSIKATPPILKVKKDELIRQAKEYLAKGPPK